MTVRRSPRLAIVLYVFIAAGMVGPLAAADYRITPAPAAVPGLVTPLLSLNGPWKFQPAPTKDFFTLSEKKAAAWKTIQVPGDWTMQGFAVKPWTAAGYLKTVLVPKAWAGKRVFLRFDGVQSDARIWVNGRPAGSHQGGFNAFEFDVTDLIRPGSANTIAAAVQNESAADELASGTQYAAYQFGGITRKAALIAVPETHITAMRIITAFDEKYEDARLRVDFQVRNSGRTAEPNAEIMVSMIDPAGNAVCVSPGMLSWGALPAGASMAKSFEADVVKPRHWDAEHPSLYRLIAELKTGGRIRQTITRNFGFRQVEVVGTQVFINGSPIKVRGVNRHETHPLLGRSLTPELWRKDAELFRAANINYIRTSHYPPAEEFLDACDELGLFVECEAPLVWINHGANEKWKKENPDDPKFTPLLERAIGEMIAFHADHPSIIFWSLANESGWGPNWAKAREFADNADPTRPKTFHDQTYGAYNNRGSVGMPIANYHYPAPNGPEQVVDFNRPLLYGEYCHVNCYNRTELAADPGVRDEYGRGFQRMWELINGSPVVLGGAIWAGINDIFFLPEGRAVGYGDWGLIDGWRREKPEYWHVKKSYSPIHVRPDALPAPAPGQSLRLQVENRHDFTNLSEVRILWRIEGESGAAICDLAPRSSGVLALRPKSTDLDGRTLHLEFWDKRGFMIDAYEIAIGRRAVDPPPYRALEAGSLATKEDGARITIEGGSFRWIFDRTSGAVTRGEAGGVTVMNGGPALMILPQTTGPCVTDYSLDTKPFNEIAPDWATESVEMKKDGEAVTITVKGRTKNAAGGYTVRFDGQGRARFDYEFKVSERINPRQWGLVLYLSRDFDTLSWSRKAQWSVYPENHIGRPVGTAKAWLPGREFKFRVPPAWDWKDDQNELGGNDFRSTKSDLRWAALESGPGAGLLILPQGSLSARAFLDGNRVGWLAAGFNSGGGDLFFAGHHKLDDRPLSPGESIKGSFTIQLVRK
jgi:beta-galactosidase